MIVILCFWKEYLCNWLPFMVQWRDYTIDLFLCTLFVIFWCCYLQYENNIRLVLNAFFEILIVLQNTLHMTLKFHVLSKCLFICKFLTTILSHLKTSGLIFIGINRQETIFIYKFLFEVRHYYLISLV